MTNKSEIKKMKLFEKYIAEPDQFENWYTHHNKVLPF